MPSIREDLHREIDLETLQASYLQAGAVPAATSRRVRPAKGGHTASGESQTPVSNVPLESSPPPARAGIGILGNIQEREVGPPSLTLQPISSLPFPKATHRRQSKFALGRKQVTLLRRPAPSSEANAPLVADRQPGGPEADADAWLGSRLCSDQAQSLQGPSRRSDVDQTSNGAQQLQSHGMDPEQGLDTRRVLNEVVAGNDIAKENEARLADMAPAEVAAAQAELASRLPAKTLTFLRQRGAARMQSQPEASRAAAKSSLARHMVSRAAEAQPAAALAGPTGSGAEAPATAPDASPPDQGQWQHPAASQPLDTQPAFPHFQDMHDQGGTNDKAMRQRAALRFDLDGHVLGLQSAAEPKTRPAEALLRDPLRVDEGSQSTGLTVSEAVQLLRSSLPAQQVAALKTITTVLMQARPAGIAAPDAATIVPMPPASDLAGAKWHHVWQAALEEAEVVVALRLALDSGHTQVVAAAASALCALLGANKQPAGTVQALDLSPSSWQLSTPAASVKAPLQPVAADHSRGLAEAFVLG
ncbi:hypothetical protein WJX84_002508 [Apatococcus fuscideae]|uniref:RNA polymerase II-associated protein 1 N-terminal domain-containing protein n=1 Tax=Apatococcus fuscideae TaxID=2026836 RepID=A0AAW1SZ07_9CHLO